MTPDVLRVEGLSFRWGNRDVLKDISLSVGRGQLVYLKGPNGSGKSTFLRCVAGLVCPHSGSLYLSGERFKGQNRKQRAQLAFVSDNPAFYDDLTAVEHLRFVLQANRRIHDYAQVELLLERFGLLRSAQQYPSSYSRGMREKLALVIAFALNPRLYLFDEPYAPLDSAASEKLSFEIAQRVAQGASVVLSCHHPIPGLAPDKVLLLREGSIHELDESFLGEHEEAGSTQPQEPRSCRQASG
ncbi:MAG: ABC transporter ATP-binding protein [Coriobacteriaceae bacterium]|nr:ABC transporter ATP-binding protein [Coriobacteriaceae bacterium]